MDARTGVSVVLLMLALAGCASEPYVPGNPPLVVQCELPGKGQRAGPALVGEAYGMQHSPIPLDSVQFDSQVTASRVAIQGLFADRTATDTVSVTARLVSCSDIPTTVRVRTSFLKATAAPAEQTSAWRVVHLSPRATAAYTEYSVSRDVAAYLIEIGVER